MSEKLIEALAKVKEEVLRSNNKKELEYFEYHESRFKRMAIGILNNVPSGGKILDIGSHYLHSSMILKELGYQVYGVDVPVFWEIPFVQERMKKYNVKQIIESDLETFNSVDSFSDFFDGIVFTEIFEHITFNPVQFWIQVHKIIRTGGAIYLTTPNSFALPNVLRSIKNLISFKSIGITVQDIFDHVTYGHHWKEFSKKEIKEYFGLISNDFKVECKYFSFQKRTKGSFRHNAWQYLLLLGTKLYVFSPSLEAIIKVNKEVGIHKLSPKYY